MDHGSRDRLRPFLLDRLMDDPVRPTRLARGTARERREREADDVARAAAAATAAASRSAATPATTTGPAASTGGERALSPRQYREAILRDLAWLLNTQCMPKAENIEQFPAAAASVINFGLPDFSGVTLGEIVAGDLARVVQRAIRRFEPRILPETLIVRVVEDGGDARPGRAVLEIEGEIWAVPAPEAIYVRTEIDLGSGEVEVKDR